MPLQGPGHFKENVRTLMHEVGKSPHVKSRAQALAIAYAKERGRQRGGQVGVAGWTDQERNLYAHHLGNLYGSGKVVRPGGEISTVYQIPTEHAGRFYNIPTIWGGRELSENEARQRAAEKGWEHWPSYPTPQEADRRYIEDMHPVMDEDNQKYQQHVETLAQSYEGYQQGGDVPLPRPDPRNPKMEWRPYGTRPVKTLPEDTERYRNYQAGGEVAGLVDHDADPELPRTPEPARMIPMLPLPHGYRDPAYIGVIQRLIEGQRRLNAMRPDVRENLQRYWRGGLAKHFRVGGLVR